MWAWRFSVSSDLSASCEDVWAFVGGMRGVNHELFPLVKMTFPPDRERLDSPSAPRGVPMFRSWLLLFGVLPFDYVDSTFQTVEPNRGFLETSTMLSQRSWRHERRLKPASGGCRITDEVTFHPRLPVALLAPLYWLTFLFAFQHRHRRLRSRFGDRRVGHS